MSLLTSLESRKGFVGGGRLPPLIGLVGAILLRKGLLDARGDAPRSVIKVSAWNNA